MEILNPSLPLPELPPGLEWINAGPRPAPLRWEDFTGRPVLVEVWTSG